MVPLFTAVGNFGALVCVYLHLFKKVGVGFTRVGWRDIFTELRESAAFFVSRIASTVYGAANPRCWLWWTPPRRSPASTPRRRPSPAPPKAP